MTAAVPNARLVDVELDESIGRSTPDVEHERAVAILTSSKKIPSTRSETTREGRTVSSFR